MNAVYKQLDDHWAKLVVIIEANPQLKDSPESSELDDIRDTLCELDELEYFSSPIKKYILFNELYADLKTKLENLEIQIILALLTG